MKKMQEEKRNRYELLIDRGNEVFERMLENIFILNARNMALIGIILATLSIILTMALFLLLKGWQPSNVDILLLNLLVGFLFISLVLEIFSITLKKLMNTILINSKIGCGGLLLLSILLSSQILYL
jgi:hypothetical protein